jgi:hypothetical protein
MAADPNFAPGPNVRAPTLLDEIEEEEKTMISKGRMRNGQTGKKYKTMLGAAGLLGAAVMAGGL